MSMSAFGTGGAVDTPHDPSAGDSPTGTYGRAELLTATNTYIRAIENRIVNDETKYLPVFNLSAYGAAQNGTTDDTTAWTNALAAVAAAGGGRIQILSGATSCISAKSSSSALTLPANTVISGGTIKVISGSVGYIFATSSSGNVVFDNVGIILDSAYNSTAFVQMDGPNVTFRNCTVTNPGSSGPGNLVAGSSLKTLNILNSSFSNVSISPGTTITDVLVSNCDFTGYTAVTITGTMANCIVDSGNSCSLTVTKLIGNTIQNSVSPTITAQTVVGNLIQNNTSIGTLITGSNIGNNYLYNNTGSVMTAIAVNSSGFTVNNNILSGDLSTAGQWVGINWGYSYTQGIIQGNQITGCGGTTGINGLGICSGWATQGGNNVSNSYAGYIEVCDNTIIWGGYNGGEGIDFTLTGYINIHDNIVINAYDCCIRTVVNPTTGNIQIHHNNLSGGHAAVMIYSNDVGSIIQIEDNVCSGQSGTYDHVIQVDAGSDVVVARNFIMNTQASSVFGINMGGGVTRGICKDNYLYTTAFSSSPGAPGILISGTGIRCTDNTLAGGWTSITNGQTGTLYANNYYWNGTTYSAI